MKLFCVLLIAIVYYLDSTDACDCIQGTPEAQYCHSEFVAVFKIGIRHKVSEFQFCYDFTVEQVLRATDKGRKSLATNRIFTASNSAMCGVDLQEGEEYVIEGHTDAEVNAHVGLCNYHSLWSDVKDDVKAGFLGGYNCSTH